MKRFSIQFGLGVSLAMLSSLAANAVDYIDLKPLSQIVSTNGRFY